VPGWTEYVAPCREKSLFWHHIWIDNGRPKTGIIANIMRAIRAANHSAIRLVNRNRAEMVNERFADAILSNNTRDFWHEAKRIRGVNASYSNTIDDLSSHDDIANMSASKYEEMFSCVSFSEDDMNTLKTDIVIHIGHKYIHNECIISAGVVRDAICKLKPGKGDGYLGITLDHLINACNVLSVHIAFLLTGMLVHGAVPRDMRVSTVTPIPKNRHDNLSSSDNYRGITSSPTFWKVLDLITLTRFSDKLCVFDLQFGFRSKRSTDICTILLKETVSYYISNDSPVYCIMLDATKAFIELIIVNCSNSS
jgi:hypothetical protein